MRITMALLLILARPALADEATSPSPSRNAYIAKDDPLGEPVEQVVYLDQGWSASESLRFYFTPQGSQLIPYRWFLALEQPDSQTLFRDNKNILRFRYLPQLPDSFNPDGLPVGFVGDQGINGKWLGLTCAACHTNEIRYGKTGYRIDGAPSQGDIRAFLASMIYALQRTQGDPDKFDRFARAILGGHDTPERRARLAEQLTAVIAKCVGYNLRNFPGYDPHLPAPPPADYARLDAVGAIVNEVYHHAVFNPTSPTENTKPANAPVSYPFLWDTPFQKLEQWLGIAESGGPFDILSLSRNVGEVIGVFAEFTIPEEPIFGYQSSIRGVNLYALEDQLKELWSPRWPAEIRPIDPRDKELGRQIYLRLKCDSCHTIVLDRTDRKRTITSYMKADGADASSYNNFFERKGDSGKLQGKHVPTFPFLERIPAVAPASMMVSKEVIEAILGLPFDRGPHDYLSQITYGQPHGREKIQALTTPAPLYKARPLDGIWATAPYLHNGSVPNLDELFQPVASRSKAFSMGVRTFDPIRVGYLTDVAGFPKYIVDAPGCSNIGHEGEEYGTNLGADERRQLIEYLKSL
jgi:hypothetical protein